jgi:hypothetical protein
VRDVPFHQGMNARVIELTVEGTGPLIAARHEV